MAEYKHVIASFKHEEINFRDGVSIDDVGDCFSDSLTQAKTAFAAADVEYNKAMEEVDEISKEDLQKAKEALRAQRKKMRKEKRKNNRKGNRKNRRQWRKKMSKKEGRDNGKRNYRAYSESDSDFELN